MVVIHRSKKHTEKIATENEKLNVNNRLSTETRVARDKRVANATHATRSAKIPVDEVVDDHYISQNRDEIIVKDEKNRKEVRVKIERIGNKEMIVGDMIKTLPKLKVTIRYKDKTWECNADVIRIENRLATIGCEKTLSEVVKVTGRHPPKAEIIKAIDEYVDAHFKVEETPLIDYVREKYPDRLEEIERNPFGWILTHTKEVVGYDRLKLLTLLSVISSRMKRIMGISRIHLNIVGQSGAGKSSVVKSVLKYLDDNIKFDATRFTEKSLGYLDIYTFDGKVVFLEQIDNQNIAYLREAMSEEKICTYVTEKVTTEDGTETHKTIKKCIEGQPAFITTSVSDRVDLEREQIANRMLNVYLKYEYSKDVIKTIIERAESEVSDVDKMIFMAYLLTRPDMADVTPVKDEIIAFVDKLAELTRSPVNRTIEILRNLVRAVAIARGKTKADVDDFNFVMQNFQLDVLFNGLGLTERDVEIIEALPDEGGLKSQEVADALKISKQYAINVLKNLERKGVVEGVKEDNKTFTWYLTMLGRKIKALINNLDKDIIEVRDEKGELVGVTDAKFRPDIDAGNDRENAVSRNDGRTMSRGDSENDRVIEAYDYLKRHGWTLVTDIEGWYGDDIIEKLKRKDLVTFNVIDGVEYVNAK
ncbi:transcriptional regulator TrmB [Sulfolobus islandicus L.S.2.15]|uniref:Transcriptional regulator TrmB n=1 Tax=Saccharolobus islandicus (strain L.S.2.15 / Lassen \|nr:helix-turn-helix domain-containing protein [Sulfolobus islandicus]ACP35850.1 transcriptional regulator TrmB [Sulfolobus islandicus L.S.2.15]